MDTLICRFSRLLDLENENKLLFFLSIYYKCIYPLLLVVDLVFCNLLLAPPLAGIFSLDDVVAVVGPPPFDPDFEYLLCDE